VVCVEDVRPTGKNLILIVIVRSYKMFGLHFHIFCNDFEPHSMQLNVAFLLKSSVSYWNCYHK